MAQFRYVAIDPAGQVTRGTMEAATEAEVVAKLRKTGHLPMRAEPAAAGHSLMDLLRIEVGRRTLRRQDVTNLTRELAIMLAAGQDLDRSLRYLVETAPNARVRAVVEQLRNAVRDGQPLAAALAQHPGSFSRLYVGLVRAGEAGGTLAPTLDRLAGLLERERSLSASVTSAMIYPAVLLLVAIGSITLLLTEVLPQFVPLFEQNGVALPGPTRMLIAAGDFVCNWGLVVLLALLLLGLAAYRALQRPATRLVADRLLLRLPVIGGLAREVLATRFTRTLGTLVLNGVPLIAALGVVQICAS